MSDLKLIEQRIIELDSIIITENEQRNAVKETKEWQLLAETAQKIMAQQEEMLSGITDSKPELNELKQQAMEIFRRDNLKEYGKLFAKIRKENYVNAGRVLSALGGDLDDFCTLADIKQTKLNERIKEEKERGNKDLAKELKEAIESKGEVITDICLV